MISKNSYKMEDGQHGILMINNSNKFYKKEILNSVHRILNYNLLQKKIVMNLKVVMIMNKTMMIVNKIKKILVRKD